VSLSVEENGKCSPRYKAYSGWESLTSGTNFQEVDRKRVKVRGTDATSFLKKPAIYVLRAIQKKDARTKGGAPKRRRLF